MKSIIASLALFLFASTAIAEPVSVDSCGEPVTFDRTPERMIVHDINMADMAFALGLQDHMFGVTGITDWYKTSPEFDAGRGNIPELAPKYPTMENLVAVDPDLFFAGWYCGMRPGGEVTPETLDAQGIQTLVLTEGCIHLDKDRPVASTELLFADMLRLGTVFAKEADEQALVDGWKA